MEARRLPSRGSQSDGLNQGFQEHRDLVLRKFQKLAQYNELNFLTCLVQQQQGWRDHVVSGGGRDGCHSRESGLKAWTSLPDLPGSQSWWQTSQTHTKHKHANDFPLGGTPAVLKRHPDVLRDRIWVWAGGP